jgi:hypothetical protein
MKGLFASKKEDVVVSLRPHTDSITTKWIEKNQNK